MRGNGGSRIYWPSNSNPMNNDRNTVNITRQMLLANERITSRRDKFLEHNTDALGEVAKA